MIMMGNGASFLTEFGVCAFPDDTRNNKHGYLNTDECESILNANDKYFTSWTYWDSNFYCEDSMQVKSQLINVFSRVYPVFTNGIPETLLFNTSNKEFVFIYEANLKDFDLTTEIFIPSHVYPMGFNVILSDHLSWTFIKDKSVLYIHLNETIKQNLKLNNNKDDYFIGKSEIQLFPVI